MKKLLTASRSEIILDDNTYKLINKKGWWINSYGYAIRQVRIGNNKRKNIPLHH